MNKMNNKSGTEPKKQLDSTLNEEGMEAKVHSCLAQNKI
jgi:hypothetical protein